MDNNLSLSAEDFKGTDIYKGIYQDSFEKSNLQKSEFSEKPKEEKNEEKEEKPEPPSIEETHENEMKAKALKQEAQSKMDKKCSYAKMDKTEKRALRVLLNLEGKSSKEKIEAVMEHYGVSKMGAINILADATKDMKEDTKSDVKKSEINSLSSQIVKSAGIVTGKHHNAP